MTRYIRAVRCPHCNALIDYTNTTRKQLVGNPLRICGKCHQPYYDFAYLEDALAYYDSQQPAPGKLWLTFAVFASSVLLVIFAIVYSASIGSKTIFAIFAIVLSLISILLFRSALIATNKLHNYEAFLQELNKRMENFKSDNNNPNLKESMLRMSNPAYIDLLADNGIDIPDYFLDRINYKAAFTEKRARRQTQLQSDLEVLKKAQEKWKMASRYLSMGKSSNNFQMAAKELGLTPSEFYEYCHNTVNDYEKIHLQYNATHSIPAEYPTLD